jgi:hypothetical protein
MKLLISTIAIILAMSVGQAALAQGSGCEKMLEDALQSKGLAMADIEGGQWLKDIEADDSYTTHYFLGKPRSCSEGQLVVAFTEACTNMLKMFTRRGCEVPGIKTRKTF